jgi:hypothetical protein
MSCDGPNARKRTKLDASDSGDWAEHDKCARAALTVASPKGDGSGRAFVLCATRSHEIDRRTARNGSRFRTTGITRAWCRTVTAFGTERSPGAGAGERAVGRQLDRALRGGREDESDGRQMRAFRALQV